MTMTPQDNQNDLAAMLLRADARAEQAEARIMVLEAQATTADQAQAAIRAELAERAWIRSVERMWTTFMAQDGSIVIPFLFALACVAAWVTHGTVFVPPSTK